MTKEIEDRINEAANKEDDNLHQFYVFKKGAKFILDNPELMREEMEKVIGWIVENKNTEGLDESDLPKLFNEYLEHLKSKV